MSSPSLLEGAEQCAGSAGVDVEEALDGPVVDSPVVVDVGDHFGVGVVNGVAVVGDPRCPGCGALGLAAGMWAFSWIGCRGSLR